MGLAKNIPVIIKGEYKEADFIVVKRMPQECLIGMDFLTKNVKSLRFGKGKMIFDCVQSVTKKNDM